MDARWGGAGKPARGSFLPGDAEVEKKTNKLIINKYPQVLGDGVLSLYSYTHRVLYHKVLGVYTLGMSPWLDFGRLAA